MDRSEKLREPGKMIPSVRRATGIVLAMLDAAAQHNLRIHGAAHLPEGPLLFVSNHFTRAETFLLPWILDRVAHRTVSSLAWHELFRGRFGKYLEAIGACSTHEAGVKKRIIRELAAGTCDWLIYPEGEMVKNKNVWGHGRLRLNTAEQQCPHHTGAALLALKATRLRAEAGHASPVLVVPVAVTYHPIRPSINPLYLLARRLLGPLPENIEEELLVEGSILFSRTDIDIVLGHPVDLREWIPSNGHQEEQARFLLERLTTRLMQEVYGRTVRNIDHLACTALSHMGETPMDEDDFARALFLASRETEATSSGMWHHGVGPAILDALSGVRSNPFESILDRAQAEGACERNAGFVVRKDGIRIHEYDKVRLHGIVDVIANEIAPDRVLVRSVSHWIRRAPPSLRTRAAELMERADLEAHASEGGSPELIPHWISPPSPRGTIVLAHGYLASPAETTPLALHLASCGWACYLVRLAGHGSSPEALARTHRADWWRSFQRGLAVARCRHPDKPLVVAGFSMGSFLALKAAAELVHPPQGLIAINAPLKLVNRASLFAPALDGWNNGMRRAGIDPLSMETMRNDSEYPDDNYCRNPVRSMHQMELAASEVRALLGRIRAPTLIVQGDRDPVVQPHSAEILLREIASPSRSLVWWPAAKHGIIRGEGCAPLHERIADWMSHL